MSNNLFLLVVVVFQSVEGIGREWPVRVAAVVDGRSCSDTIWWRTVSVAGTVPGGTKKVTLYSATSTQCHTSCKTPRIY